MCELEELWVDIQAGTRAMAKLLSVIWLTSMVAGTVQSVIYMGFHFSETAISKYFQCSFLFFPMLIPSFGNFLFFSLAH